MITNLAQVMLYVKNPKETALFWIDIMGFTEVSRIDADGFVMIELIPKMGAETSIVLMDKAVIASMQPELDLGMPSLMFETDRIDDLYEKCQEAGVIVGEIVLREGTKIFNFADTEENYYAVMQ